MIKNTYNPLEYRKIDDRLYLLDTLKNEYVEFTVFYVYDNYTYEKIRVTGSNLPTKFNYWFRVITINLHTELVLEKLELLSYTKDDTIITKHITHKDELVSVRGLDVQAYREHSV